MYNLSQQLEQYVIYGKTKYACRTVDTYQSLIRRWIAWLGDRETTETDISCVTRYAQHLREQKYANSTVAFSMISIRQFLQFLYNQHMLTWDYAMIPIPRYYSQSFAPIKSSEAVEMIDTIADTNIQNIRDRAMCALLFATGVRVSELVEISVNSLDFSRRCGTILSKKSNKPRLIFWDTYTENYLNEWIKARKEVAQSDKLFVSLCNKNMGKALTTRTIQRMVQHRRPAPHITTHSFRHGLGMRMVQANIHPRYIQQIMGHTSLNSQLVYLHTQDSEVEQAYKKIIHF